jgi:hypothetical protein
MPEAIRDLVSGRYTLWCVFWLIGLPIYAIFHISAGCAIGNSPPGYQCFGLIDASQLPWVIIFSGVLSWLMAISIWRSATNYTGKHFVAVLAKVYVGLTVLMVTPFLLIVTDGVLHRAVTGRW